MIQRLLELMKIKNLTSSQLADAIGVQRSGISHFFSGRNKPSLEFILKILAFFPDVNPDWLLFGKEPVFRKGYPGLLLHQKMPAYLLVKNFLFPNLHSWKIYSVSLPKRDRIM